MLPRARSAEDRGPAPPRNEVPYNLPMQKQEQRRRLQRDLSSDELAEVIEKAARKQGEDLKQDDGKPVSTMDDAYALAQELGIPEEYVTEAAGDLEVRKYAGIRIRSIRRKRLVQLAAMIGIGVGAVGVAWLMNLGGFLTWLGILGIGGLIVLVALVRWLAVAIGDPNLKQIGPSPVAGICRVCGRTAVTAESTFCDDHRYRSPAELKASRE